MSSFFERSFVFYLSYHNNSLNQLIHICCVWPIAWTAQIFLSYLTFALPAGWFGDSLQTCSASAVVTAIYVLLYLFIEQPGIAGPLAALMAAAGYFVTSNLVYIQPDIWKTALFIHVFCWSAQIFGHQVFEKRAPAFFDNLFQAFFMAPIFVLMEVMFALGYKKDFNKKMQAIAEKEIATFHASKTQ